MWLSRVSIAGYQILFHLRIRVFYFYFLCRDIFDLRKEDLYLEKVIAELKYHFYATIFMIFILIV